MCSLASHCHFESLGTCNWISTDNNKFDWVRQSGPTSSKETGPSVDHTLSTAKGHYMCAQGASSESGHLATLQSTKLSATGSGCSLTFYYYMYGSNIGSLEVRIKKSDGSTATQWIRNGGHGSQWMYGRVGIGLQSNVFVQFVATRGQNYQGDIALDDILLLNCAPGIESWL